MSAIDGMETTGTSLQATVVEYENAPDECTLFPRDVSGMDRMTTWITAKEDSFVDLEAVV